MKPKTTKYTAYVVEGLYEVGDRWTLYSASAYRVPGSEHKSHHWPRPDEFAFNLDAFKALQKRRIRWGTGLNAMGRRFHEVLAWTRKTDAIKAKVFLEANSEFLGKKPVLRVVKIEHHETRTLV